MKRELGVCYYPEHWDEAVWEEDAARMKSLGLSWVRIGEFAWSRIEPKPGAFNFEWLDRAIDVLGAAGLKVVMSTPTATPPRWMVQKYPDMLALDETGQPRRFGSRRHYCFSHLPYRDECRRIARALGERYGNNPHIQAWQLDNEYGCHDTTLSYSPHAEAGFRAWLKEKYGTLGALNAAWGNVFWSMDYATFKGIGLPNQTVTEPNPAHMMAFRRYSSDQVAAFNRAQADVLKSYTSVPLIHNYMGRITEFDHFDVAADLDIASWDSYPLGFLWDRIDTTEAHRKRYLRQGDPDFQAFHHDLYRAVGDGRWWVMEQQPGPVNWALYNPAPLTGMARLWAWEAYAHGAETVCYFRWRQAPFAQEQMHSGLLRPDGKPAPAFAEVEHLSEELALLPDVAPHQADVAIVFDYPSCWAWEVQPQGADFHYFRLVYEQYRAARSLGLSIDFVQSWSPQIPTYKLLLVPGLMTMPAILRDMLAQFEGTSLIGPRTNSKTTEFSIPTPLPPDLPGLDCTVEFVESLPPNVKYQLEGGGAFRHWAERLTGEAEVALTRHDGAPAVMSSGNMHYVGGWPDREGWERLIASACEAQGIATVRLPEGVRIRETGRHRFAFNYNSTAVTLDGVRIPAAGVHWEDL